MFVIFVPNFKCNRKIQHFQTNLVLEGGPRFDNLHFILLQIQLLIEPLFKSSIHRFIRLLEISKNLNRSNKFLISTPLNVLFPAPLLTLSQKLVSLWHEFFALWGFLFG